MPAADITPSINLARQLEPWRDDVLLAKDREEVLLIGERGGVTN